MSYDMLYRQEKLVSIELPQTKPPPCYSHIACEYSSLRWFASTIPKCTHGFVPGYELGQTLETTMRRMMMVTMTPV
jgi:hypothetical protein